ncbi:MAG: peptidylprolyl isomerase [Balneolaceae bacterium]
MNTDDIAIIETDFGEMYVVLYDETPLHKENFLKLANEGFYDSTTFHRVMNEFMIQGGDPNSKDDIPFNDGQGGPGYTIDAEFNSKFIHKKGAMAAARLGDQQNPERNSSGSQFYIVHGLSVQNEMLDQISDNINGNERQILIRDYVQAPENINLLQQIQQYQTAGNVDSLQALIERIEPIATQGFDQFDYSEEQRAIYTSIGGYPYLDANYTVFGEVIKGIAVVDSIAAQQTGAGNRPIEDILMKVRVEKMDKEKITSEFGYSYN